MIHPRHGRKRTYTVESLGWFGLERKLGDKPRNADLAQRISF
jgi:hypothetical protein